jgi:hypothetical protein
MQTHRPVSVRQGQRQAYCCLPGLPYAGDQKNEIGSEGRTSRRARGRSTCSTEQQGAADLYQMSRGETGRSVQYNESQCRRAKARMSGVLQCGHTQVEIGASWRIQRVGFTTRSEAETFRGFGVVGAQKTIRTESSGNRSASRFSGREVRIVSRHHSVARKSGRNRPRSQNRQSSRDALRSLQSRGRLLAGLAGTLPAPRPLPRVTPGVSAR